MHRIQEQTGQPVNNQKMAGLYIKYINLAKDAEKMEDRILSESYYQHAEHYLHAMSYLSDSIPVATSHSSVNKPHLGNQVKPQKGKVFPHRGTFLRRNRRNSQG